MALQRSRAATPEFYRRLSEGELWFLMRWQPDLEGQTLKLKNGAPVPFARLQTAQGKVVPIYSSGERLDESLKKGKVRPRTFLAGSLPAPQLLQVLGTLGWQAVVNKNCVTGEIIIPPDLMRDLANGKALAPLGTDPETTMAVTLTLLDPADYPTHLVQPVFELIRQHRNFKAAWVFTGPVTAPGKKRGYYLQFLMDPRDDVIYHDLAVVLASAGEEQDDVHHSLAREADTACLASLFQQAQPFYVAADYTPPGADGPTAVGGTGAGV